MNREKGERKMTRRYERKYGREEKRLNKKKIE